jgi:hypothetical protein
MDMPGAHQPFCAYFHHHHHHHKISQWCRKHSAKTPGEIYREIWVQWHASEEGGRMLEPLGNLKTAVVEELSEYVHKLWLWL